MVMKLNKFIGFFAMAAVAACVALAGCSKAIDDELSANEAKSIATVRQTISVSFSEELRAIADINLMAYDLYGEEVVLEGALVSESVEDVATFDFDTLDIPCGTVVDYSLSPKSDFFPEIGREYDLGRVITVKIELLDKSGKVLACKSQTHDLSMVKQKAEEDVDWSLILNSMGYAQVVITQKKNGAIELE